MAFSRITIDPNQMDGEPCIRHMRMPVATVVRLFAEGWLEADILRDWPELQPEDLREALSFAAEASRARHLQMPIA